MIIFYVLEISFSMDTYAFQTPKLYFTSVIAFSRYEDIALLLPPDSGRVFTNVFLKSL